MKIRKLFYFILTAFVISLFFQPFADTYYPTPAPKFTIAMSAPTASDDFLFTRVKENISITAIEGIMQGSGSVSGTVDVCDANGNNCASLEPSMTFNGNLDRYEDIDTTEIDSGDTLRWRTESVSGTPYLLIIIDYTVY